jgi:predicted acylesterase/phospholipase RssA/CRP-like cAMP-binding protein
MNNPETVQMRRVSGLAPSTIELLERYFGLELDNEHALLDAIETVLLTGNTWLFRQDDPGDSLYFLVRGRLQVWRNADDPRAELSGALLGEILPGDSVGEVGLLTAQPRSAGVRAIRDSLLVRVDRATFEQLATRNPALVMKLAASVAQRLRQSTLPRAAGSRPLTTIAIVALDDTPRVRAFCDALSAGLSACGETLDLAADRLGAAGAPQSRLPTGEALDDRLKHWLHELEGKSRFLLYRSEPAASPWSRFAVRQADLVLLIGEASCDPLRRRWEVDLLPGPEVRNGPRCGLILLQGPAAQPITGTAAWLDARRVEFHLHVRADRPDDLQRVLRVLNGRANGLVLGGGAARGFAHLGVHRALVESGTPVDWCGGTSIGAIMATTLSYDWTPQHARDIAHACFVGGKPFSDYTLPMISLLSGARMVRLCQQYLPGNIEDMPLPYFCVSSNLSTGALNLHERGPVWKAVRASAALPGVLPPVVFDGQLAVDGAVLNNLPVDIMQGKPVGKVIAVELTARKAHRIDYEEVPGAWTILGGKLRGRKGAKVRLPGLATLMLKATEVGTMARVMELGARADLLLRPPVHQFSMMGVKHFDAVVEAGYQHAREQLPRWLAGAPSGS